MVVGLTMIKPQMHVETFVELLAPTGEIVHQMGSGTRVVWMHKVGMLRKGCDKA